MGVSFDKDKNYWTKAIRKDKLEWPQISSLTGHDNIASEIYMINAISYNVLIDNEGVIMVKNIHGNELEEKLNQLF